VEAPLEVVSWPGSGSTGSRLETLGDPLRPTTTVYPQRYPEGNLWGYFVEGDLVTRGSWGGPWFDRLHYSERGPL
jgi:hypothetical protein